jgi:hypothetical protein
MPSPPYVVPSIENKATFWLMAIIWPAAGAVLLGQKVPLNKKSSPT